jgi:hypothetical protein
LLPFAAFVLDRPASKVVIPVVVRRAPSRNR